MPKAIQRWLALAATAALLTACDDHNNPGPLSGPQAFVQVLPASPDAPPVNVLIDGQVAAQNLDYGQGSAQISVPANTMHTVTLQGLSPPTTTPTTLGAPVSQTFDANTVYRIIAAGPVASIAPIVTSYTTLNFNGTQVQVAHAAPGVGDLSVYFVTPGAALSSSTPIGPIAYQAFSTPTSIPPGTYDIMVTSAGSTTPIFDSGPVNLPPGADLLFVAVENTGVGNAPIRLAGVDQNGDDVILADISSPGDVRVVHDVADGPALGVYANANTSAPLVPTISFPSFTSYLSQTAGQYTLSFTPASNPSQVLVSQEVNLAAGSRHSVYAIGPLASIATLVTSDHDRRVATYAKLRIIQGSPSSGPVDVYLTPSSASIASLKPTYASMTLATDTGFQPFTAGTYALTVTAAGSKTPLLGPVSLTLQNSGVYTAVTRDAPGGGAPYGLIELDDFAP